MWASGFFFNPFLLSHCPLWGQQCCNRRMQCWIGGVYFSKALHIEGSLHPQRWFSWLWPIRPHCLTDIALTLPLALLNKTNYTFTQAILISSYCRFGHLHLLQPKKKSKVKTPVWVCSAFNGSLISYLIRGLVISYCFPMTVNFANNCNIGQLCPLFCRFWARIKSNLFARPSSSQENSMPGGRESLSRSCTHTMGQSILVRTPV